MKYFFILFSVPLLFFSSPSFAVTALSGQAQVILKSKKKIQRFDQAIVVDREGNAAFEALDDFGNTVFRLNFIDNQLMLETGGGLYQSSDSRLGRLITLPLTREEFISFLLYRLPQTPGLNSVYDEQGQLVSVEKKGRKKKKNYKITFINLQNQDSLVYPSTIEMTGGGTHPTVLTIIWKQVFLQND